MPIFDQGYHHWSGKLTGHAWRWLVITRQGMKAGLKNRYLRILLMVAWLPALVLVAMLCLWGLVERNSDLVTPFLGMLNSMFGREVVAEPRHYRVEVWTISYHYFLLAELRFSLLLVLFVGPSLISQDLRFNALPLYFSRPLRRFDYFLGKLGVISGFIALVVVVPAVIAYVLGMLFSLDLSILGDTYRVLLASAAYGALISVSAGLLMLALSSLSRNSRYVAIAWAAVIIVSSIVATILDNVDREQRMRALFQNNPPGASVADVILEEDMRTSKTNWRGMMSYTTNLSRVGQSLLGTDNCWENITKGWRPRERSRFLANIVGPQYPWYWSAAVLVALIGFSACILNYRIKSLDRLK